MAQHQDTQLPDAAREALLNDPDFLRQVVQGALQNVLEVEIAQHLAAGPYERTDTRKGYRHGYRPREVKTRVGALQLRVPQDREGTFRTELSWAVPA